MVSVIVSFATEDFVTPESDDALGWLADELTKRDILGCFAMVGDKARALRDRGRRDIIAKVAAHEIDYHSNDHHFFPPMAPIVEEMTWDEGVTWLLAHEVPGLADLAELFGQRPAAWVRTDGHWTAQSLCAFGLLGMKAYGLRGFAQSDPGLWSYMNMVSPAYSIGLDQYIGQAGKSADLLATAVAEFEQTVAAIGEDALVVYGTHPCMWACETFYDLHNIKRRGRVPPKEKWRPAPLVPSWRHRRDRQFFGLLLDHLLNAGVEFITYGQLADRYGQPANEWLTRSQLASLARQVQKEFSAAKVGGTFYSAAEILAALCWALARYEDDALPARVSVRRPLGPVETPQGLTKPLTISASAALAATRRADAYMSSNQRLPAGVDGGRHHLPPAQLLAVAAEIYLALTDDRKPGSSTLSPGPDCPREAEQLADVAIQSQCLPKDYHPARLLEQIRLQSWALKPATPR